MQRPEKPDRNLQHDGKACRGMADTFVDVKPRLLGEVAHMLGSDDVVCFAVDCLQQLRPPKLTSLKMFDVICTENDIVEAMLSNALPSLHPWQSH